MTEAMHEQEQYRLWALDGAREDILRWKTWVYGPQQYSPEGYAIPTWDPPTEDDIQRTIRSLIIGSHSGRIGAQREA